MTILAADLAERWMHGTRKNSDRAAWMHPLDVAKGILRLSTETETGRSWDDYEYNKHRDIALLHDIIEDGVIEGRRVRAQDLLNAGIAYNVVTAVIALTKRDDETKEAYLGRLQGESATVKTVKCMDRYCNLVEAVETGGFGPTWLQRYVKQTKAHIFPLMEALPADVRTFFELRMAEAIHRAHQTTESR